MNTTNSRTRVAIETHEPRSASGVRNVERITSHSDSPSIPTK